MKRQNLEKQVWRFILSDAKMCQVDFKKHGTGAKIYTYICVYIYIICQKNRKYYRNRLRYTQSQDLTKLNNNTIEQREKMAF